MVNNINRFSLASYKDSEMTIKELLEQSEAQDIDVNPKFVGKVFVNKISTMTRIIYITQIHSTREYIGNVIHICDGMVSYAKNQILCSSVCAAPNKTMTKRRYDLLVSQLQETMNATHAALDVKELPLPNCQVAMNKDFIVDLTQFDENTKLGDIYEKIFIQNETNRNILRTELLRFRRSYLGKTIWQRVNEGVWIGFIVKDIYITCNTISFEGVSLNFSREGNDNLYLIDCSQTTTIENFLPPINCNAWAVQDSHEVEDRLNALFKVFHKV